MGEKGKQQYGTLMDLVITRDDGKRVSITYRNSEKRYTTTTDDLLQRSFR